MIDDETFDAIAASLAALARSRPRDLTPVATVDQVDLLSRLRVLAGALREFGAATIACGGASAARWEQLADLLADASQECRQQVVIDQPT